MHQHLILVVEDDPNDETLTLRALRQSGVPCEVVVAHNAKDAVSFLQREKQFENRTGPDPEVIFVDNTLPGSTGAELVTEIRSYDAFRGIPIVVFSGSSDFGLVDRCARAGANSFLEKPLDMGEYLSQIGLAARYWVTLNLSPMAFGETGATMR